MNRLPPLFQTPPTHPPAPATLLASALREPSLVRLAQSIAELNPQLARALCQQGLDRLSDAAERAAWQERLARSWSEAPKSSPGSTDQAA